MKSTPKIKKCTFLMANAKILRLGTNPTYIALTHVGGNASFSICIGGNANFNIFRYKHVGIPKAKFCVGGLSQRKDPTRLFLYHSGI